MAKKSKVVQVTIRAGIGGTRVCFHRDRLKDGLVHHTNKTHEIRDTWGDSTKILEDITRSTKYTHDVLLGAGWMSLTIYAPYPDCVLPMDTVGGDN